MGVMHQKIYAQSILRHYASDNTALNSILDAYRSRVTLVDFECHLPVTCARAIAILAKLAPGAPDSPSERERAVVENATRISLHVLSDSHFLDQSTRAIPPFDVIVCIREAIDALVQEAEDVGHARIGTDELLPLVAFSLVKSGVKNLYTIGLYARKFTQNSLGPDYE